MVPPQACDTVMEEAHLVHTGIARMKSLTHQFVWWPKIDSDLETKVRNCSICQKFKSDPPQTVLHPCPLGVAQTTMSKDPCRLH